MHTEDGTRIRTSFELPRCLCQGLLPQLQQFEAHACSVPRRVATGSLYGLPRLDVERALLGSPQHFLALAMLESPRVIGGDKACAEWCV
jgi:hypothetical protein